MKHSEEYVEDNPDRVDYELDSDLEVSLDSEIDNQVDGGAQAEPADSAASDSP